MNEIERKALSALRFDWAPQHEDVWGPLEAHVNGLNGHVAETVLASFDEAKNSSARSPLGVAILGGAGAGKTHLLHWLCDRVQRDGGYFFLVGLLQGKNFWQNIVHALLSGLQRTMPDGVDQLSMLLQRLSDRVDLTAEISEQITGARPIRPEGLAEFVTALRRLDGHLGRECQHTARALVLLGASDFDAQDVGETYLTSQGEAVPGEWMQWGIRPAVKSAQEIVVEISRLLALTGPSLLAVDQIDTLIAQSKKSGESYHGESADAEQGPLMEQVGVGLMELRETMNRTLTVVACFNSTWREISRGSVGSVRARFRVELRLERIRSV